MNDVSVSRKAWIALAVLGILIIAAWVFAMVNSSADDKASAPSDSAPSSALAPSAEETGSQVMTGSPSGDPTTRPPGSTPGASPGEPGAQPGSSATIKPAADGATLEQITQPPDNTVWAFKAGAYSDGARVELVFRPYGVGPASMGKSVAVSVISAKPTSGDQSVPALSGRNAVLVLGATEVDVGGTYEGVGVVTTRGDRSVIVLQSASLKS